MQVERPELIAKVSDSSGSPITIGAILELLCEEVVWVFDCVRMDVPDSFSDLVMLLCIHLALPSCQRGDILAYKQVERLR